MAVAGSVAREEGVSKLTPGSRPATQRPSAAKQDDAPKQGLPADDEEGSVEQTTPGDVQAEAAANVENAEQKVARLERELKTATGKRIPDLQSALDRSRDEAKMARDIAMRATEEWPAWIEARAAEGWTAQKILDHMKTVKQRKAAEATVASAQRAEPMEIISELYDSDDDDDISFARFLRRRQKADWPITRANLATHRAEFDELTNRAAGGEKVRVEKPKAGAAVVRKGPPPVAGGGGANLGGEKKGWQPNESTTDALSRGFRERDAERASRR